MTSDSSQTFDDRPEPESPSGAGDASPPNRFRCSPSRFPEDAALESRRADRRSQVQPEQLVCLPGSRPGRGGGSHRRRRVAAGTAGDGPLWGRAAVAGHPQHPDPGPLQHRDQPLHPLHRRAHLHRKIPDSAGPAILAGSLPDPGFRVGLSLSGRHRGHPGHDPPAWRPDARSGVGALALVDAQVHRHRHIRRLGDSADLRRQGLQLAEGGDVPQAGHGVRLPADRGAALFQPLYLVRHRKRLLQVRNRSRPQRRGPQRQRKAGPRRGLGWGRPSGRGRTKAGAYRRLRWRWTAGHLERGPRGNW